MRFAYPLRLRRFWHLILIVHRRTHECARVMRRRLASALALSVGKVEIPRDFRLFPTLPVPPARRWQCLCSLCADRAPCRAGLASSLSTLVAACPSLSKEDV